MSKEDGAPSNRFEIHENLINDINAIGDEVFADIEADEEAEKALVIELLDKIKITSAGSVHEAEAALFILRRLGYPIDEYGQMLGMGHDTLVVADKLIEFKGGAAG